MTAKFDTLGHLEIHNGNKVEIKTNPIQKSAPKAHSEAFYRLEAKLADIDLGRRLVVEQIAREMPSDRLLGYSNIHS